MAIKLNNVFFNLGTSFRNLFLLIIFLEKQVVIKQSCQFSYLVIYKYSEDKLLQSDLLKKMQFVIIIIIFFLLSCQRF